MSRISFLAILACALFCASTRAADPSSFELHASAPQVLLGTPFQFEGTVRYPERFQLSFNNDEKATGAFTFTKVQMDPPTNEGGMAVQQVHIQAIAFDLGQQTLPSLPWTLTDTSAGTQTLQSPPVKVEVTGPDTKASDLHDIQGPLKPPTWMMIVIVLLIAPTLGLAGYEAWTFLRPGAAAKAAAEAMRKPPADEALDGLAALRESGIGTRETYDRLSEILRVYFERRFDIPALVLTTSDFLRMMRQAEIDRPVMGLARDVFARCDLVKFAKLIPEPPELRNDIESGIQIVRATMPKPEPEPVPLEKAAGKPT